MSKSNQAHQHTSQETAPQAEPVNQAEPANMVTHELKLDGITVTLPSKATVGAPITEKQATIIDAFLLRQFTNNQNANIKARAEALAKLPADASDELRAKYAPLTAEQIAAIYETYEPNIGGGPRLSTVERNRRTAAWSGWVNMILEQNVAAEAGLPGPITKANKDGVAQKVRVPTKPVKGKNTSAEDHEAALAQYEAVKDTIINKVLSDAYYAERVQIELDKLTAAQGTKKAEPDATVTVAGGDLV